MKLIIISFSVTLFISCTVITYSNKSITRYKSQLQLTPELDSVIVPNSNTYFCGFHVSPSISKEQSILLELISIQKNINLTNKKIKKIEKNFRSKADKNNDSLRKDTLKLAKDIASLQKKAERTKSTFNNSKKLSSKNNFYVLAGLYKSESKIDSNNIIYTQKSFLWGMYEWADYE
ncbi:MAG: hypothetical protein JW870_20520 [Candidatus Delongbacteria bacterium]|nr:hypothetical protein [Candidatus Delongbacteria bacterium]